MSKPKKTKRVVTLMSEDESLRLEREANRLGLDMPSLIRMTLKRALDSHDVQAVA